MTTLEWGTDTERRGPPFRIFTSQGHVTSCLSSHHPINQARDRPFCYLKVYCVEIKHFHFNVIDLRIDMVHIGLPLKRLYCVGLNIFSYFLPGRSIADSFIDLVSN